MTGTLRLLLVEDNPGDARLFRLALEETGSGRFSLHHVETLRQALGALSDQRFDIVMLDLSLPDSQGLDTVREVLKADRRMPVIVLTGTEDEETALQAVQLGAQDYLQKGSISSPVLVRSMIHAVERHRLRTQLEEVNQTRNNLFSIISHDLKSPFYSLVQVVRHLVDEFEEIEPATMKSHLTVIENTSEKLYELVENLLRWAGSQTGKIEIQPSILPLRLLADNVIGILQENADRKHIRIVNMIDGKAACWADSNMIHTVLRNLVSNGIKFTRAGGTVAVTARTEEEAVTINVADTGLGMSRDRMEKLFRTENRSSRTGTAGETGTGLGLLVCKEFVERNLGTIRVSSVENEGTTFSFTLPVSSRVKPGSVPSVPDGY